MKRRNATRSMPTGPHEQCEGSLMSSKAGALSVEPRSDMSGCSGMLAYLPRIRKCGAYWKLLKADMVSRSTVQMLLQGLLVRSPNMDHGGSTAAGDQLVVGNYA